MGTGAAGHWRQPNWRPTLAETREMLRAATGRPLGGTHAGVEKAGLNVAWRAVRDKFGHWRAAISIKGLLVNSRRSAVQQ